MILITGGSGYLGGRITKYLRQQGFKVRVGSRKGSVDTLEIDFSSDLSLEASCKGVDQIIHLAGMNAHSCQKDPESSLLINGLGTLKLLEAAEKEGVSKFIYFSTAHVYGSPLEGKIDENSLTKPLGHYSISHRVAEDYVIEANQNKNISGTVFRLTNSVGAPILPITDCWMLVVNDLCRQVVINKHMSLHSNEFVQRDYVPISTVCKVINSTLLSDMLSGEIVNLSSGIGLSLRELTSLIVDRSQIVLGYKPSVNFNTTSANKNYQKLKISNRKLKEFGIEVEVDLTKEIDEILLNCVDWFLE